MGTKNPLNFKRDNKEKDKIQTAKLVKRKSPRTLPRKTENLSEIVVKKGGYYAYRPGLALYTLYFIYKNLYILGIIIVRRCLHFKRLLRMILLRIKGRFYAALHRFSIFAARMRHDLTSRMATPFRKIKQVYKEQLPAIRAERIQRKIPATALKPVLELVGALAWKIIATIFNHGAPIAALIVMASVIGSWMDIPLALKLTYEGTELGYIQSEKVFDEAAMLVQERFIDAQEFSIRIPSFTLEEAQPDQLMDSRTIADRIIQISGSEIETAYGLWVDDQFLGAVLEKDVILDEFARMLEENQSGREDEKTSFSRPIRLAAAIYPAASVKDPAELIQRLNSDEEEEEVYTVQSGDTPTEIADKNGMPYAELLRLNPTIEDELKPGDELKTKVARPFLSVRTSYQITEEVEIPFEVIEVENATYARGYENVTQEGQDGLRRVHVEITMENGVEISRTVLDADSDSGILRHPVNERVTIGVNDPKKSANAQSTDMTASGAQSAGFIWPTSGGRATTYRNHTGNGIDIAPGGSGHPIYAAAGGTVTKVVNGYTGYGHYIMIDHGNGYATLYAHNSANYVAVGERVEQGQVIAAMGQTGWATGAHVHFEVRYNGSYMNPTQFIGTSG